MVISPAKGLVLWARTNLVVEERMREGTPDAKPTTCPQVVFPQKRYVAMSIRDLSTDLSVNTVMSVTRTDLSLRGYLFCEHERCRPTRFSKF
jgi:hypothetical protein